MADGVSGKALLGGANPALRFLNPRVVPVSCRTRLAPVCLFLYTGSVPREAQPDTVLPSKGQVGGAGEALDPGPSGATAAHPICNRGVSGFESPLGLQPPG